MRARRVDVLEAPRREDASRRRGQAELPGEAVRRVRRRWGRRWRAATRRGARPGRSRVSSQAPIARNFA